jgi:hypothetical protein
LLIRYEDTQGLQDDQGTQGNQWAWVPTQGKQGKHLKYTGLAHLE